MRAFSRSVRVEDEISLNRFAAVSRDSSELPLLHYGAFLAEEGFNARSLAGTVMAWDVVGFDEVADLQQMPKEVITTMKTYCESGTFQRGQEEASGYASIAMFGNTDQPIDVKECYSQCVNN